MVEIDIEWTRIVSLQGRIGRAGFFKLAWLPLLLVVIPTWWALLNAPEDFTLQVRDIRAYTGAGWLVPLCVDIQQMPGLGKEPAALNVDIDEQGRTVGLF